MRRPEFNNAVVPINTAATHWKAGWIDSFVQFERGLREMRSPVHFISVTPITDKGFYTTYPVHRENEPKYMLQATVNGHEEAEQVLEYLNITPSGNLERLKTTGILLPIQPIIRLH